MSDVRWKLAQLLVKIKLDLTIALESPSWFRAHSEATDLLLRLPKNCTIEAIVLTLRRSCWLLSPRSSSSGNFPNRFARTWGSCNQYQPLPWKQTIAKSPWPKPPWQWAARRSGTQAGRVTKFLLSRMTILPLHKWRTGYIWYLYLMVHHLTIYNLIQNTLNIQTSNLNLLIEVWIITHVSFVAGGSFIVILRSVKCGRHAITWV